MFGFYPFADIKLRLFCFYISTVLFNIILCYRVYLHFQHFFNKVKSVQYISPHTPIIQHHSPKPPISHSQLSFIHPALQSPTIPIPTPTIRHILTQNSKPTIDQTSITRQLIPQPIKQAIKRLISYNKANFSVEWHEIADCPYANFSKQLYIARNTRAWLPMSEPFLILGRKRRRYQFRTEIWGYY